MARKQVPRAGVLVLQSPALGRHRANHSEAKKVEKLIPTPGMSCSWHSVYDAIRVADAADSISRE